MKPIRELFGLDYLLGQETKQETTPEKLSDCVKWEQDADQLLTIVLNRIRDEVREKAKEKCYKANRTKINRGDIFGILQEMNLYYYTPAD